MRLLPWTSLDGHPCYLSVEVAQLASGKDVLAGARAVLADEKAGEFAVRSALTRATESLEDVIRIAVSRGGRLLERDG
ncbi:hypothetical protein ABZ646_10945 [Streptomyces sp. NPDC007162]|uniref:hypothetical protein n=1 Tax=Streptomyces sp. NPDC007162 TaxID=3156917 RepID=UPI0034092035